MKAVIIMAYYNRPDQLAKTVESIRKSEIDDYWIVIADDASDLPIQADYQQVDIIRFEKSEKRWTNPEPAYNTSLLYAIRYLDPQIIILQNPECMHVGDILKCAIENVTDENYISFGCYSIDKATSENGWDGTTVNRSVTSDMGIGWYNHSIYRPRKYDFCSAITARNIIKLNGYDERFSDGCAYGDDYLLHRIKCLGLQIKIVDDPFVVHQWHENSTPRANGHELIYRNSALYAKLSTTREYKAIHIYTENLCT